LSPFLAIPLFIASLAVTLVAARLFARRLDRLGVRLGFPEALIGLLTALAADGPEISAALFALIKGANSVGVGVIVGSNTFNLAAMLGVSGILAGSVLVSRPVLLLEGVTGGAITLIAAAVLLRWVAPALAAVLAVCVIVPYLVILLTSRRTSSESKAGPERQLAPPSSVARRPGAEDPAHHLLGLIVMDVVLIAAASAGMVQAALALGDRWQISHAVLGVLVLAPLTSIPNAITGVRLGLARRSTALVGETFNSNTINLAAGVIVPSLFVTLGALSVTAEVQLAWLVGMTALTLLMLARRGGMRRAHAWALVVLYGGFACTQLVFA
jgi:cation:H+ antiporter